MLINVTHWKSLLLCAVGIWLLLPLYSCSPDNHSSTDSPPPPAPAPAPAPAPDPDPDDIHIKLLAQFGFLDTDTDVNEIGGHVFFKKAETKANLESAVLFWGKSATEKLSNSASVQFLLEEDRDDPLARFVIAENTILPANASHLLLFKEKSTPSILAAIRILDNKGNEKAGGPGGNLFVGEYIYGEGNKPKFPIHRKEEHTNGDTEQSCFLDDGRVMVINMENETAEKSNPHRYSCDVSTDHVEMEVRDAYGILNDAYYHGQVVFDMYHQLAGESPQGSQIKLRAHYGRNLDAAFWDGTYANFGDGNIYYPFFPMVCLDIVAHEVSHAFTERYSGLIYAGESGGINESFSDIAGEAAEFFVDGTNDWIVHRELFWGSGLRFFDEPENDGHSIRSVKDYHASMDVHYSSGIFNHAFYQLANTENWNTEKAFQLFLWSNVFCWLPDTTFQSGAGCVLKAAESYGYSRVDVRNAFAQVDLKLWLEEGIDADFTFEAAALMVQFTDMSTSAESIQSWYWTFGDSSSSMEQHPVHTYANEGQYLVELTVVNKTGKQDTIPRTVTVISHYCNCSGWKDSKGYIEEVQIGLWSNSSLFDGYKFFEDTGPSFTLGEAYPVDLKADKVWTSVNWAIWIDFNQNFIFDQNERVFEKSDVASTDGVITIPNSAAKGQTRMRISLSWAQVPGPCESPLHYGEVEDYSVDIK